MTSFHPRLVPVLLLDRRAMVKTRRFRDPVYLGDPINVMRIFSDKAVDEIVLLDISSTRDGTGPNFDLVARIAEEAFMPLSYGGGITDLDQARRLLQNGADKIVLGAVLRHDIKLVTRIAEAFGSQAVAVSIDVKCAHNGTYGVVSRNAQAPHDVDVVAWAQRLEAAGAGEIILQCVDRDGTLEGYDHVLIRKITSAVTIPVVACGGARDMTDLVKAVQEGGASAAAAGALFVFFGRHKAVLINPPSQDLFISALGAPAS